MKEGGRGRKKVIVIGGTERGKSTQINKIIDSRSEAVIVHDTNNQKKYWHLPEITLQQFKQQKSGKYRCLHPNYEEFFQAAFDHFKHGMVVSEDASNYLTPQKNMKIFPILIALRHDDHDDDIIFVTHSIADTPKYIIRQCNEILLFKTGDVWDDVKGRFDLDVRDQAEKAFNEVNNSSFQYIFRKIVILKTGTK